MAAAFRILHFPPTASHFSHTYLSLPSPPSNHRLLLSLTTRRRKSNNLHLFLVRHNPPLRALPTIQSESAQENTAESQEEVSRTRLLVSNVPWTSTADDLRPLFQNYGTIVDIEFSMYNKARNRGLVFVTMGSHEEAAAALNNLEAKEFEGRVLRVNWAYPKKPKQPPPPAKPQPIHNLFVANLPFQARAKDLKEFFNANNADVVSAEIIFHDDPPRRSAGYGFVSFNTKAEAEAALVAFNEKEFMGRTIRVARSRRFLRQETKAAIEPDSDTTKLIHILHMMGIESQKGDLANTDHRETDFLSQDQGLLALEGSYQA